MVVGLSPVAVTSNKVNANSNTNLVPGSVNTNWVPGPVNTNWGPRARQRVI